MINNNLIKIIAIAIFILIATSIFYFNDRQSLSSEISKYPINIKDKTKIKIGIIGDSWAAGKKLDSNIHAVLLNYGIKNTIISSGHGGAKSKLIYQHLFESSNSPNSSRYIIESNPDYCIVIAGVNDAMQQMGRNYYSHHIRKIIRLLLHNNIKPVIVSLPEFNLIGTIDDLNIIQQFRNYIISEINNNGDLENIISYRSQLVYDLKNNGLINKVILIDFDKVCKSYNNNKMLYRDKAHLNKVGNKILCDVIVSHIISDINN